MNLLNFLFLVLFWLVWQSFFLSECLTGDVREALLSFSLPVASGDHDWR